MSKIENVKIEMYAVRNKDGKWFSHRSGCSDGCWVDDIKQARIYGKTCGARAVITWWADNYPDYDIPELVVFKMVDAYSLDESERIRKKNAAAKIKKLRDLHAHYERQVKGNQNDLDRIEAEIAEIAELQE